MGRERELGELQAALGQSICGHGALIALVGPPGVGKTFLAEALALEAERSGARVAWGRCWEDDGVSAYWPWLRLLEELDPELVGMLEGREPGTAPEQPRSARMGLFRHVLQRLRTHAGKRPLLLIFDDLHAADTASLLLLQFVAHELMAMPLLVACTWREVGQSSTSLSAVTALARRIPLRGLSEAEVGRVIEHHLGHRVRLAVARRVHRVTDGNPLFVEEVARLRAAEEKAGATAPGDGQVVIPPSVRDAIARRLEGLDEEAVAVLSTASVVGRELDVGVLAAVGELSQEAVVRSLRLAVDAGLLEQRGTDCYRFAHGLMHAVLYERLTPARRAKLHLRVARRLESTRDAGAHASELAVHYRRATPQIDVQQAVEWSLRAARQAMAVLAYEEAIAHARGALELPAAGRSRVVLLLTLGEAQMAAGDSGPAHASFRLAAQAALEVNAGELFARAALGFGSGAGSWAARGADEELIGLLEQASEVDTGPGLRALVLARRAEAHVAQRGYAQADDLSAQAVSVARTARDQLALTRALSARLLATMAASGPNERTSLTAELRQAAERAGDREAILAASLWSINDGLERADRPAVAAAKDRLSAVAERLGQPHLLWNASTVQAMLALLDGRLGDAERDLERARREGEGAVAMAEQTHAVQLIALRREQGRLHELEPAVRAAVRAQPEALSWRCAWIAMLSESERPAQARGELACLPPAAFCVDPEDYEWPARVTLLAEICARLHERERASDLYRELAPYAGQVAVVSFSVLCRGAVDRYLGLLAATLGRLAEAERRFDSAQTLHAGLGSPLWIARTEADRAGARAAAGDSRGARRAAQAALRLADELGLVAIGDRARVVRAGVPVARRRAEAEAETLVFCREGDVWALGDPGAPVRLRDARGLGYIARLLASPGEEHFAGELAGAVRVVEQPALDQAAKAAYRARVRELRAEADVADRIGDPQRSERAQAELAAIAAELNRVVGLHGHDRHLAEPSERARSSVTKAIRAAIRRIAALEPDLAHHLDGAIRTGTFCRYVPDARHPIDWRVTM